MTERRAHLDDEIIHKPATNIWLATDQLDIFGRKHNGFENAICLPGRLWCATVNRYPIGFAGVDLVFDRDGLFSTMDPSAGKRLFLAAAYQRLIIRDPVGVLYC